MKNLINPKKPFLWLILAVVITAVVLCVLYIPRAVNVPDALDDCVKSVLYEVHYSSHTEGKFPALAYTTLATVEKGNSVTLYGVMMYREYTATTLNKLEIWGKAHYPFAITATKNDDGTYTATDCWWPEDGANHVSSIRKKFPSYCEGKAVDYGSFYAEHDAACNTAAAAGIADDEKYVLMQSENQNVRLAYCAKTSTSYINFGGGYVTDGAYAQENGEAVFTFGECKLSFIVSGDDFIYSEKKSEKVPQVWKGVGDTTYLADSLRFSLSDGTIHPVVKEDTAPIGPTVTVTSSNWLAEETLREMFGQYVPSTYFETDHPKYLPVRPIETRAQLERFIAAYADVFTGMDLENFAQYDETFFEDNFVLITYYRDGMDSCKPKVDSYVYAQDGSSLWLSVRLEVEKPTEGDAVVGQWLLFSGIAKEDYKKATGLEAYVNKFVEAESSASTALSFTGKVKQVEGRAVLMECADVPQFSNGVWVELGDAELDPVVGETYTVTYEDIVMPSLPPRITAVTITKA